MRAVAFIVIAMVSSPVWAQDLLVFGQDDGKTFLGCLSCSRYDADSLWNEYNTFGSAYSSTSVFNLYSEFGSQYSDYSPCNEYATSPPIIVDRDGVFSGALTINPYHQYATYDSVDIAEKICEIAQSQ